MTKCITSFASNSDTEGIEQAIERRWRPNLPNNAVSPLLKTRRKNFLPMRGSSQAVG